MARADFSSAIESDGCRASSRCPLCRENDKITFAFNRNGHSVYSCKRCALEFLFPQPTDETLYAIYSDTYFLGQKNDQTIQQRELLKRATARLYLDAIVPLVRVDKPQLLEIGCGSGDFLIEAQSRGFKVEGLEYSEHAAGEANARLGIAAVRVGSPEKGTLPTDAYDVIGAFDVIEHLRSPAAALKHLSAALRPQGLIALATPSLNSWSRRLLGRHWMEYKTEHLTYFSRKSITSLLDNSGLEVIQLSPNYKALSFDYISAHFARFPVPMISPLVRLLRNVLPAGVAYRPIKVLASGILALARKKS